jgi:hypothetical protein
MRTTLLLTMLIIFGVPLLSKDDVISDVRVLHRLGEKVAKADVRYQNAVKEFNKAARAWETDCKSSGKTPSMNGFTNPTCMFIPVPIPPPGTNK